MRFLLDTQLAFWWQTGDLKLPPQVVRLVEASTEPVFVSRASLWEMAIKAGLGKLRVDLPRFAEAVTATGFSWLPIENEHLLQLASLPVFDDHKDPFDRLLVAQAMSEPLILLTTDGKLERYGNPVRLVN